jgi:phage-related protein
MAGQTDRLEIEIIASDKASAAIGGVNKSLGGLGKFAGVALASTAGLAVTGLGGLVTASISSNAALETAGLQFETLLGSADAASAHIKDLYKFGAETPFETGPIIAASKSLLTFGGTSLDTMENLRMFGNAASVTGGSIEDVSFWMGRAYSAIQGGKPFGEAAARLQEMGILSASGRSKLEDMTKAGASSAEIWSTMTGEFTRFDGAMEKQAGTWEGLQSTISDVVGQTIGGSLKPLFGAAKEALGTVATLVQGPEFAAMAANISTALTPLAGQLSQMATIAITQVGPGLINGLVLPLVNLFATVGPPVLQLLGTLLTSFGELAGVLVGALGVALTALVNAILPMLPGLLAIIVPILTTLVGVFSQLVVAIAPLLPPLLQLITGLLGPLSILFTQVIAAVMPLVTSVLGILIQMFTQVVAAVLPIISQILPVLTQLFGEVVSAIMPVITAVLPILAILFTQVITAVLPLIQMILPPLAVLFTSLIQAVLPLISAILPLLAHLLVALIGVITPLLQALMPLFVKLVTMLAGAIQSAMPYIEQFANWISSKVVPAIDGIGRAIGPVIRWIGDLASKLASITLPSWLTPGSPTPFEMGLRGISKAARQLAMNELPQMAVGLRFGNLPGQMPLSTVGGLTGGNGGVNAAPQIVLQYQPTFSTADRQELQNKLQPMLDQAIRQYNRGTSK